MINILTKYKINLTSKIFRLEKRIHTNLKKFAFTLSEILITLGIIGVISAITLPILIQNYRRKMVATKLKTSESIITQMLNMAQADYGDPNTWDFNDLMGSTSDGRVFVRSLCEKYFLPYLNDVTKYDWTTLKKLGYKEPYKLADGRHNNWYAHSLDILNYYVIQFANGIYIIVHLDGYTDANGNYFNSHILLYIDVNGIKGPNTLGIDTFLAKINSRTGKFEWYLFEPNKTRDDILKKCKNTSIQCGALIKYDGWEIKKDYPFKI